VRHLPIIVPLRSPDDAQEISRISDHLDWPLIGWNLTDDPRAAVVAYGAGATSVFPSEITATSLMRWTCPSTNVSQVGRFVSHANVYSQGAKIAVDPGCFLSIESGLVSECTSVRGKLRSVLGVYGAGSVVPTMQDCPSIAGECTELYAHTDVAASVVAQSSFFEEDGGLRRLQSYLRLNHGWAIARSCRHADDRIVELLRHLARHFGSHEAGEIVLRFAVTHEFLAAAVGTTRSTITRQLSALRRRDVIRTGERSGSGGQVIILKRV
jgi:CRP-like cAMP-binding protein